MPCTCWPAFQSLLYRLKQDAFRLVRSQVHLCSTKVFAQAMISALVLSGSRDASSWESRGMGARKINITRTKAKVLLTKKPPFGIHARLLFHVPLVDLQLRTRRRHVI